MCCRDDTCTNTELLYRSVVVDSHFDVQPKRARKSCKSCKSCKSRNSSTSRRVLDITCQLAIGGASTPASDDEVDFMSRFLPSFQLSDSIDNEQHVSSNRSEQLGNDHVSLSGPA
jgi:hypothetical protein